MFVKKKQIRKAGFLNLYLLAYLNETRKEILSTYK